MSRMGATSEMSRRFGRLIGKNKKKANEIRKKTGKSTMLDENTEVRFLGRGWLLPMFLMGMLIWYLILFIGDRGFMFWFTVSGYTLLSLFLFFLKRPYLVIGKDFVESRRFGGVFKIQHQEIEKIVVSKDSTTISFNVKRPSWSFSKLFHRMDITLMNEKLQAFAEKHQINVEKKGN
jgi:hypothetical protein